MLKRQLLVTGLALSIPFGAGAAFAQDPSVSVSKPPVSTPPLSTPPVVTAPAAAPPVMSPNLGKTVRVDLKTSAGTIVLELYPDKAPLTVANFLRYVKGRRYDGVHIYRAVHTPGVPETGFIQGGVQNDPKRVLLPIKLEPTTMTGLHHKDGTITMARLAPNSATSDFVIMIGDNSSYMDANPAAPGDNLGYAAFGQVSGGMDVVKKILTLPAEGRARNPVMMGQILDPPVLITSARIENETSP